MAAINVTIGEMPPLLRSMVEGMLHEDPRFVITPEIRPAATSANAVPHVNVLVLSEDALERVVPLSAAQHGPTALRAVAIGCDWLDAAVIHLNTHRRRLDQEPRQTLSQAILDAAGALAGTD